MRRPCTYCEKEFYAHTHNHSYCSHSCRDRAQYMRSSGIRPSDLIEDGYVRRAYSKIIDARRRGLDHSLSLETVRRVLSSPCYYCGEPSLVIERFDNNKGYTDDNVVPACVRCNIVKGTIHGLTFMKVKDMISNGYVTCILDGEGGLISLINGARYVRETLGTDLHPTTAVRINYALGDPNRPKETDATVYDTRSEPVVEPVDAQAEV